MADPIVQDLNTQVSSPDVDSWMYDLDNFRLMKHFGIDSSEAYYYQSKIQSIKEWAKSKTKSADVADWLSEIKKLQREIGSDPNLKPINEMNRYIRLDLDATQIEKEKALYKESKEVKKAAPKPAIGKGLITNEVNRTMGKVQKDIKRQVQEQVKGIVQKAIREAF